MLSYRHSFHAGNHADVLKHCVLVLTTRYLLNKPKALFAVDTHAGAGIYSLHHEHALKNREFESGIERLWSLQSVPAELEFYLHQVRKLNIDQKLSLYPGSPWLLSQLLRPQDHLSCYELHSSDLGLLEKNLAGQQRTQLLQADGFRGLMAQLPPSSRRGLVLIDPPYEVKTDYRQVLDTLKQALKRFATGTYLLWYPRLNQPAAKTLPGNLEKLSPKWLSAQLWIREETNQGMWGSGMFVINPPWTLKQELSHILPFLAKQLGQQASSGYRLTTN